mgnify:CR=1 FL=1
MCHTVDELLDHAASARFGRIERRGSFGESCRDGLGRLRGLWGLIRVTIWGIGVVRVLMYGRGERDPQLQTSVAECSVACNDARVFGSSQELSQTGHQART